MLLVILIVLGLWGVGSIVQSQMTARGYRAWDKKSQLEKIFIEHCGMTRYTITGNLQDAPAWVRYNGSPQFSCGHCGTCKEYLVGKGAR